MFIAKPHTGQEGQNIKLFNDLKQLPIWLEGSMVAQRYIDSPLLLDELKFDLRIYVVITGIHDGDMKAYMADEGLARFCTMKYEKPDAQNRKKTFMHLTNFSLNKQSKNFKEDVGLDDVYEPNQASKRTLTSLFK